MTHTQVPKTAPAGVPGALKRSLALQMDFSKGEERSTSSPGSGLPKERPCQYPGEKQKPLHHHCSQSPRQHPSPAGPLVVLGPAHSLCTQALGLPVLGSTSAGKCGGGFPGVKCSLLYVIRGVRGWTWWGCCTTGTLFDCGEGKNREGHRHASSDSPGPPTLRMP